MSAEPPYVYSIYIAWISQFDRNNFTVVTTYSCVAELKFYLQLIHLTQVIIMQLVTVL